MAHLTYEQLRAYAQSAGAAQPDIAAAIALAETDGTGETTSHNPIPPDNSYGPWQINMLGSMGPARRKALGISSNTQLFDPAINARAMVMISNGGTHWTDWSTYTDGKYKKYLKGGGVTQASTSGLGDGTTPLVDGVKSVVGGVTDGLSGITDVAKTVLDAGNWLSNPRNWVRIAYVVLGGGIALVGLNVMLQSNVLGKVAGAMGGDSGGGTVKSAVSIGKTAVTKGKSAQAAKPTPKAAPKAKAPAKAAPPKPKAAPKAAPPKPEAAA